MTTGPVKCHIPELDQSGGSGIMLLINKAWRSIRDLVTFYPVRGWIVILGGILVHLSLGTLYTYGNLSPYIVSYIRKNSHPRSLQLTTGTWIYACTLTGFAASMLFGGMLSNKIGPRWTTLIGSWIMSAGVALSYLTIKVSFWLLLLTYGLMFGVGVGIGYIGPLSCAMKWFPRWKGVANGFVVAGFGLGALIFDEVQTSFINPSNSSPSGDSNEDYFTESSLLDRVPTVFLILGGTYAVLQFVGSMLLTDPPENFVTQIRRVSAVNENIREVEDVDNGTKSTELTQSTHSPPPEGNGDKASVELTSTITFHSVITGSAQPTEVTSEDADPQPTKETPGIPQTGTISEEIVIQEFPEENQTSTVDALDSDPNCMTPTESTPLLSQEWDEGETEPTTKQCGSPDALDSSSFASSSMHTTSSSIACVVAVETQEPPTEEDTRLITPRVKEEKKEEIEKKRVSVKAAPVEVRFQDTEEGDKDVPGRQDPREASRSFSTSGVGISLHPKQMLQTKNFYILWFMLMFNGLAVIFTATLYKVFALTFIKDDHFLAAVGATASVFNSVGRILWGLLADRVSYKFALVLLSSVMTIFVFTFYATTVGGKPMFFIWVCVLFSCIGGNFSLFPTAIGRSYGPKYVGVNYGLLFTSQTVSAVLVSVVSTVLIDYLEWYSIIFFIGACSFMGMMLAIIYRTKKYVDLR